MLKFHFIHKWVYDKWSDGTIDKMSRKCSKCGKRQYRVYNNSGISCWFNLSQ